MNSCENIEDKPDDSGMMEVCEETNLSELYTPVFPTSRKRKLAETVLIKTLQTFSTDTSPCEFDSNTRNPNILSSTMNDSISSQLEKFNINSTFCVERNYEETSPPMTENLSPPGTPSKQMSTYGCNFKRTPVCSPKLGSPERSQILYPKLHHTSKKRLNEVKRFSPAKKQLFNRMIGRDPIDFFCRQQNCSHVIEKVFMALSNKDLYMCTQVSDSWKETVLRFERSRLNTFINDRIINKENYNCSPGWCVKEVFPKQSTPILRETPIYELTNSLTEGQHLQLCQRCNNPTAIVQHQISQCSRDQCGYIACLNCSSCSTTGPENFLDSCKSSKLVYEKPRHRPNLLDSPKKNLNDSIIPSFLQDTLNLSQVNSSGYVTESDLSNNSRRQSSFFLKDKSYVLKICNAELDANVKRQGRRSSPIVPVVPMSGKNLEPVFEPSSPPKVKTYSVCSKRSKKALRRL